MTTLPDAVPADAETVSYFEQIITERVPSRHLPGRYSITRWFVCPGCQVRGPALPILTITRCACGLYLHANATDLHVWRAPATEAAE